MSEETDNQELYDRAFEKLAQEIDFVVKTYDMPKVRKDRLAAAARLIRDLKGRFNSYGRNV